jgi:hypothetical protein
MENKLEEALMAWIRIESGLPRDPKVAELSSNDARWAYMVLLCAAKEQDGAFQSWQHLEACVPQEFWKWLPEIMEVGLLHRITDGVDESKARFEVANWDKYQRAYDPNNAARVARSRARKRDGNDLDMDVTDMSANGLRDNTIQDNTNTKESKAPTDRQRILKWLSGMDMQKPVGYVMTDLMDMVKGYGYDMTVSALSAARQRGNVTTKAMVAAAETSLRVAKKPQASARSATPIDVSIYDNDEDYDISKKVGN